MTLKNASLIALIFTTVLTLVLAWDFTKVVVGAMRDVIPQMAVLRSLVYLLANMSLVLFFFVFHKRST